MKTLYDIKLYKIFQLCLGVTLDGLAAIHNGDGEGGKIMTTSSTITVEDLHWLREHALSWVVDWPSIQWIEGCCTFKNGIGMRHNLLLKVWPFLPPHQDSLLMC